MVEISSGPQCDAVLLQSKWTTRHSLHKALTPQRWISPIKQVKWEVRFGLLWFIGSMEAISYLKTSKALYLRTRKESNIGLTHWGRVTHICVIKLTIIGSDNGLIAWSAPSHYQNQCWNIVDLNLRNKLQWNVKRNPYIFIHENTFANVVWKNGANFVSASMCW